jgi:hypothetical protein
MKILKALKGNSNNSLSLLLEFDNAFYFILYIDSKMISEEVMLPSYDNPKSQFAVSQRLSAKQTLERSWIKYDKKDFWFVLDTQRLIWYKDVDEKDKKGSINLNDIQIKRGKDDKTLITLMKK